MSTNPYAYEITYNYQTKDFEVTIDGDLIGFGYRTWVQAETEARRIVAELKANDAAQADEAASVAELSCCEDGITIEAAELAAVSEVLDGLDLERELVDLDEDSATFQVYSEPIQLVHDLPTLD